MDNNQQAVETFVAKVDAFAEGLSAGEQAMFADLISDGDDDVAGFSMPWPGLRILAPTFISSGGGSPKVFRSEDSFIATGGGSPKV